LQRKDLPVIRQLRKSGMQRTNTLDRVKGEKIPIRKSMTKGTLRNGQRVSLQSDHHPPSSDGDRSLPSRQDVLDQKMELWTSIIQQRQILYRKMVGDMNSGHRLSDEKTQAERMAALKHGKVEDRSDNPYVLESKIKVLTAHKITFSDQSQDMSKYPTPQEHLDATINQILKGEYNPPKPKDTTFLSNYLEEFDKMMKQKNLQSPDQNNLKSFDLAYKPW